MFTDIFFTELCQPKQKHLNEYSLSINEVIVKHI